jgi:aminopeptidase N
VLDDAYVQAMRTVLRHPTLDAAFKELVLTLPAETYIAEQLDVVDPQRIHAVREAMREQLARRCSPTGPGPLNTHRDNGAYTPDPVSSGRRALAGLAWPTCAWPRARHGRHRSGPARPTSASRTRAT